MNVTYLALGTTDLGDPYELPIAAVNADLLGTAAEFLRNQSVENLTITYTDGSVLRFTR